jgi:hypothetical protein
MRKEHLEAMIDSITPKLYGFCTALTRSEEEAEQIFVDAYTVFILKEKYFVAEMQFDIDSKSDRISTKRYFLNEILKEIYELARLRAPKNRYDNSSFLEYESFYDLNIQKRAILYLKDVANMNVEDLQEIFVLQRHQIIELLHNSYFGLIKDTQNINEKNMEMR